jgi:hypothetical protein
MDDLNAKSLDNSGDFNCPAGYSNPQDLSLLPYQPNFLLTCKVAVIMHSKSYTHKGVASHPSTAPQDLLPGIPVPLLVWYAGLHVARALLVRRTLPQTASPLDQVW